MTTVHVHVPVHTIESAPAASRNLLEAAQAKFGFVPNLLGVLANSPALLEGYLKLAEIFEKTSLTQIERQIVLLAVSYENFCAYCMAAHTAIAQMHKVDPSIIAALRNGTPIADARLEALREFAAETARTRGWPGTDVLARFTESGYTMAQGLEVVLGVGVKSLSNYANQLADTPLDPQFAKARWTSPASSATATVHQITA